MAALDRLGDGWSCRSNCGACCVAISISSPMPGHPRGKAAGLPCANLTRNLACGIFGESERPSCCAGLQALPEMCGEGRDQALAYLSELERLTEP